MKNIMKRAQRNKPSNPVYKFLLHKLKEQNTFWSYITDAPQFRYGGVFPFNDEMQKRALAVKEAIKDFELALEERQKALKGESR